MGKFGETIGAQLTRYFSAVAELLVVIIINRCMLINLYVEQTLSHVHCD